jgi:hypothetical protein
MHHAADKNSLYMVDNATNACLLQCPEIKIPFVFIKAVLTDFKSLLSLAQAASIYTSKCTPFPSTFETSNR